MHPVHKTQMTSLNVKGGGDSQTCEGRRFVEVQLYKQNKKRGGGLVSTHILLPKYLEKTPNKFVL